MARLLSRARHSIVSAPQVPGDVDFTRNHMPQRSHSLRQPSRHANRRRSRDPKVDSRRSSTPNDRSRSSTNSNSLLAPPEDYLRMRQFIIDKKGKVINRGDSFRRRAGSNSSSTGDTNAQVDRTSDFESDAAAESSEERVSYDIYVLGSHGSGKTSLINQFMTSEHRNPFVSESDNCQESSVSICIDNVITDFMFFEGGSNEDQLSMPRLASAYIIVFSCDSIASYHHAAKLVDSLRDNVHTRNKPVVLTCNKVDLARRRLVDDKEANKMCKAKNCGGVFETSLALNHGVDELLVGLLAEIQRAKDARMQTTTRIRRGKSTMERNARDRGAGGFDNPLLDSFRRFSQRRQKISSRDDPNTEVTASCGSLLSRLSLTKKLFKSSKSKLVNS